MNDVKSDLVQVTLSDGESSNSNHDDELDSGAAVSPNNVNTEAEEENDEQIFRGKDGSCWQALAPNQAVSGRLQQQNIMRIRPGPTAYTSSRIISDTPLSLFRIFSTSQCRETSKHLLSLKLSELRVILTGGYL